MSLVSFIDNPQQEMERIENEEDAQLQKSDERMYNLEVSMNDTSDINDC
jgi:hypothetical protein